VFFICALLRSAFSRFARSSLALLKSAFFSRLFFILVLRRRALTSRALLRLVDSRLAKFRSVLLRLALLKLAFEKSLRVKIAPLKSTPDSAAPLLSQSSQITPRVGGSSHAANALPICKKENKMKYVKRFWVMISAVFCFLGSHCKRISCVLHG